MGSETHAPRDKLQIVKGGSCAHIGLLACGSGVRIKNSFSCKKKLLTIETSPILPFGRGNEVCHDGKLRP
jgi:hypothetical protein